MLGLTKSGLRLPRNRSTDAFEQAFRHLEDLRRERFRHLVAACEAIISSPSIAALLLLLPPDDELIIGGFQIYAL